MKKGTQRVQDRRADAQSTANRFTSEFSGQFRLNPANFGCYFISWPYPHAKLTASPHTKTHQNKVKHSETNQNKPGGCRRPGRAANPHCV